MAWRAKLTNIIDDSSQYDQIKIEITYLNLLGRESFSELYPFSVEDDWEVIKKTALKKLGVLNFFRDKVDILKQFVGKYISEVPNIGPEAVSLGLRAEIPVLKGDIITATNLGLKAEPPILKEGL